MKRCFSWSLKSCWWDEERFYDFKVLFIFSYRSGDCLVNCLLFCSVVAIRFRQRGLLRGDNKKYENINWGERMVILDLLTEDKIRSQKSRIKELAGLLTTSISREGFLFSHEETEIETGGICKISKLIIMSIFIYDFYPHPPLDGGGVILTLFLKERL